MWALFEVLGFIVCMLKVCLSESLKHCCTMFDVCMWFEVIL